MCRVTQISSAAEDKSAAVSPAPVQARRWETLLTGWHHVMKPEDFREVVTHGKEGGGVERVGWSGSQAGRGSTPAMETCLGALPP